MLTKLQAINEILTAVGETAALTLVSGAADTTNAEVVLDAEARKVLVKGFDFNTDEDWEIAPDSNGHILVPTDALFIDAVDPTLRLTPRNGRMWDKRRQTDVFDRPVRFRIIRDVPFEACPYHVQRMIVAQATKKYQRAYVGSAVLDQMNVEDQMDANATGQDAESDADDYNILDNPDVMGSRRRRRYLGVY